jgi:hypothetical protein
MPLHAREQRRARRWAIDDECREVERRLRALLKSKQRPSSKKLQPVSSSAPWGQLVAANES